MTFLEKLKSEHPSRIDPARQGGAYGCPVHYKYEQVPKIELCKRRECEKCWNREMPEAENAKSRRKEKIEELYAWCETSKCEDCPIYKIIDFVEVCDFDSMSEEMIDGLYEAIRAAEKKPEPEAPTIKDSGNRREFETGAVRDSNEANGETKGRCDLLPLDVVANQLGTTDEPDLVLAEVHLFTVTSNVERLYHALEYFRNLWGVDTETMWLEIAKHMADGAKKYAEDNWKKGIPVKFYIDSAVRHYFKFLRGDTDERHDRAFCWNIACCIWTCKHLPELNDYAQKDGE